MVAERFKALAVYPVHVSGGAGHVYRSAFRRDWPTHQPFPILWPYRVLMLEWNIVGFPTDLFDFIQGDYSDPAEISDDGQEIIYVWEASFLLETARLEMRQRVAEFPTIERWRWLFTDNVRAGFCLVTYDGYRLRSFSDRWETSGPSDTANFTFTAVGEFGTCFLGTPRPYFRMTSLEWEDGPDEDRVP